MTRAALFLSDQFARLHHRLAPTSLLQSRQLTRTYKHPPSAIGSAASKSPLASSFFDGQQRLRAFPPVYKAQIRVSTLAREDTPSPIQPNHSSAGSWIAISLAGLLGGLVLFGFFPSNVEGPRAEEYLSDLHHNTHQQNMAMEFPPGRPETLTKEEEEKLREFWIATFKVCGVSIQDPNGKADAETSSVKTDTKDKKRKMSLFRRVAGGKDEDEDPAGEEDKFGLTKVYNEALKTMSPQEIRESFWGAVKIDNPDALLLRFLRARKWDVQRALIMMVSAMKWRSKDMRVDEEVMKNGELVNLDENEIISPTKKRLANDIMAQLVMGKSFLHGVDKEGRPMSFIRVRLHRPGAQSAESLERFTVYQIETTRLMMIPPVDTANICFDMTDFGLANLDYAPIKFIIKCFEANYPESLGVVLLHKAPWIFQGVWKIIRGWLDPVVAAKVHFTNSKEEMQEYIDIDKMMPELEGDEKWDYKYLEPVPGENDAMKDTATKDKLKAERQSIIEEYEKLTAHWLQSTGEEAEAAKAKRTKLAGDLKESYWRLDPYVRARSLYDRIGVINPGGKINFYPGKAEASKGVEKAEETPKETPDVEEKTAGPNGTAVVAAVAAPNGTAAVASPNGTAAVAAPNGTAEVAAAPAPNGTPVVTTA